MMSYMLQGFHQLSKIVGWTAEKILERCFSC